MKMNLKVKKSGYLHRFWRDKGKNYQRFAEMFKKDGQIKSAEEYQRRAEECFRRSASADPKAV